MSLFSLFPGCGSSMLSSGMSWVADSSLSLGICRAGFLNSIAGLISTLVNVYSSQHGHYSITARITITATAVCSLVTAVLFGLYNFWMLQKVKVRHEKELEGGYF